MAAIGWYIGFNLVKGNIPFYSDFVSAKSISISFDASMPIILVSTSLFLYLTLFASGILLLNGNKYGAILSYFQCPFRLMAFIPISLFFLAWPIKYVFGTPSQFDGTAQALVHAPVLAFLSIRLLSEILKTTTVARWHVMKNRHV